MSAIERWTLMCDGHGPDPNECREMFEGHPGEAREDLRTTATLEGWRTGVGNGYDYCPKCWEKQKKEASRG